MTYRMIDVCCCGGLGSDGYAAVFGAQNVYGSDLEPQPDYPYPFLQANALDLLTQDTFDGPRYLDGFDGMHLSFPCQIHTDARHLRTAQGGASKYLDLLTPGLALLLRKHWGHKPWVVENVDDRSGNVRRIMAPREGESLIMLCATMFGLPMWRHRLFLANFPLRSPAPTGPGVYGGRGCRHDLLPLDPITGRPRPWGVWHVKGDSVPDGGRTALDEEHGRQIMGSHRTLPWAKLKEGFPPAYTSWVGADMLVEMRRRAALDTGIDRA